MDIEDLRDRMARIKPVELDTRGGPWREVRISRNVGVKVFSPDEDARMGADFSGIWVGNQIVSVSAALDVAASILFAVDEFYRLKGDYMLAGGSDEPTRAAADV